MTKTELAVIGAGPAGLAAASAAARLGVQVTLVDEYPTPGGQYLKGAHWPVSLPPALVTERQARALLSQLAQDPVDLRTQTLVWGLEGRCLALRSPGGTEWLEAEAIVVATGARELVLPFPGWTLPGVMTLGAAQLLAKGQAILPGRRVLLAGSGPLLLPVACGLSQHGAQVVAVLEASRPARWLGHAPAVWGNWDRLREGAYYVRQLRKNRIAYRLGWTAVQAIGQHELEGVVLGRLDRQGRPLPGSQEQVDVDALCLGFGFVPNVELTQLAGCLHQFDPARGGWVPSVDERLETSVPGVFVAGEAAGIGGAAAAMLEGRIAGLAAAHRLGRLRGEELSRELRSLAPRRRHLQRFAGMLNTLFVPPPGLDLLTADDTPICRCEEVSVGEVRAAVARGALELDALKTWTRVGQGPCQGRTCGPLLARLVAHETGQRVARSGLFRARPPLKPVPLGELAMEMRK